AFTRLRVPVLPAAARADRARERDAAARARRARRRRRPGEGHARARRPRRAPAPLSEAPLGRRAAARCPGARLRRAAEAPARRRAYRQPGRAVGRRRHFTAVRAQPRIWNDARPRDPRRSAGRALRAHRAPGGRKDRGMTSLRMLQRDWRAGELRVLAAALVIAVASVTTVGFF